MNQLNHISILVHQEEFLLHPLRFVFRPKDKSLICADIHIGKGSHFRKNGIAIPRLVNKNNFWNLAAAFELFEPDHFVVLGDMVHSSENEEWSDMSDFLDNYPGMSRTLIRGNHEIEHDRLYEKMGFDVSSSFRKDGFAFIHDEADRQEDDAFTFSGHIHPAVSLYGQGRQHLKVACFWLKPDGLVLPAFGTFTGSAAIRPKKSDRIFAVTDQTIIEIK
ncbi:MAG: ligase-associated DNA damage response endonuclease PdeM [Flavobacteriales bacterium]|nr:ligase-associated DNA damage response endonuclease PdeM [Flavobacteriales bacterium]